MQAARGSCGHVWFMNRQWEQSGLALLAGPHALSNGQAPKSLLLGMQIDKGRECTQWQAWAHLDVLRLSDALQSGLAGVSGSVEACRAGRAAADKQEDGPHANEFK